jgi:DNA-directed RNA polymerase specialized sigma24 family protein
VATVGRLIGQLFPVTGDLHEAEEVVQEAFARASTRWRRIRDYDVPEAWVRRVAMNLAADRSRRHHRQLAARDGQELAGSGPAHAGGPAAAIRRGRQRRRHIAGVVAAVLAVVLAVSSGVTGRLVGSSDLPATAPVTTLPPLPELDFLGDWPASPADEAAGLQMEREERRCPGGLTKGGNLIAHFRSAEYRRLVMIGGKPPALGETTVCWAVGVFDLEDGAGKLSRPVRPVSIAIPLTADLDEGAGYAAVYGQVDKRAFRVRVRFSEDRPILDVPVIQAANQYLVNFYVGLYPPGWEPVEVTAFDGEGRQLAGCTFLRSRLDVLPPCPGK